MSSTNDPKDSSNVYRIEALKGAENYATWRVKMEDILTSLDLWDYARGVVAVSTTPTAQQVAQHTADTAAAVAAGTPPPAPLATGLTQDAWSKRDRAALTAIRLRVADAVIVYVSSAETSKVAWETLSSMFQPRGSIGVVLARRKFYRAECAPGGNIEEHVRMMRVYQEELNTLGQKILDADFAMTLLTSLPESWNSFIASIEITDQTKSTDIIARILQEDRRQTQGIGSGDLALVVKGKSPKPKSSADKSKIECFYCKKLGHYRSDCLKRERDREAKKGKEKGASANVAKESTTEESEEYAFASKEEVVVLLNRPNVWLADSAATSHVCKSREAFKTYKLTPHHVIKGLGGHEVEAMGKGSVDAYFSIKGELVKITLTNVLHAPLSESNLLSLGRITDAGLKLAMRGDVMHVLSSSGKLIGVGKKTGGLYQMNLTVPTRQTDRALIARGPRSWDEWHRIMGHISPSSVKLMKTKAMVDGMEVDTSQEASPQCDACIQAKQTVQPFPKESMTQPEKIGDLTVVDLWGPARVTGLRGERLFMGITDVRSRRTVTHFIKSKSSDVILEKLKQYQSFLITQAQTRMRVLRADNGTEFVNAEVRKWLDDNGIKLELTAPHSSAQNGIAERVNRTIVENARAMLIGQKVPWFLWPEAMAYATYIKNRSPTRALGDKTPDEVFWGKKPNVSHLQEFGSRIWVLRQDGQGHKLQEKSRRFLFTGFSEDSRAYRYYNPETRAIQTSRNVIFEVKARPIFIDGVLPDVSAVPPVEPTSQPAVDNQKLIAKAPESPDQMSIKTDPALPDKSSDLPKLAQPQRTSSRLSGKPRIDYKKINDPPLHEAHTVVDYAYATLDDPLTVAEAKSREDWAKWKEAMDAEIGQLKKLGTYTLVDCPPDRKPVGCRWVFHLKLDHTGAISRYKARLVAQGFAQRPGLDFNETYSPVVRMESVRVVLAIGNAAGYDINTLDADGAYLNGTLKETIFMRQPPEYGDGSGRVCLLAKTLYGLKQSGREWHEELDRAFAEEDFESLDADRCVYVKQDGEKVWIVPVHVDDMLATSTAGDGEEMKNSLRRHFKVKDLGPTNQFLGMEIARDRAHGTLKITQSSQIKRAISRFGMDDAFSVTTPLDPNVKLLKTPADIPVDTTLQTQYQSAIGSLMYVGLGSRPDISFAIQNLSQFSSHPTQVHWTAVKRLIRYLKGTPDIGLRYGPTKMEDLVLVGYSDADWAGDENDRKSVSGYVFLLGKNVITWGAKKQATVALSSMEAEYMALSYAVREAIWLRNLLGELGLVQGEPTEIFVDNQGTIAFAKSQDFHGRSKHIDIRHHFVRECINRHDVAVSYCPTDTNLADLFTKALPRDRFNTLLSLLGL